MKLGMGTWILSQRFGEEKTLRLIAGAGFDGVDWDFSSMAFDDSVWNRDDWRERACRRSFAPCRAG